MSPVRRAMAVAGALLVTALPTAATAADGTDGINGGEVSTEDASVAVGPEPDGTAVSLDTTTYLPAGDGPHPAVLLTHGFGGSTDSVAGQAEQYAEDGYVVLTWSARGFGDSGGRIHLADPDYEGADSEVLLDTLAARDDVVMDAAGDPRVAAVGASYGGALALMLAGADPRVDTVVAAITWNDLADAFFPDAVQGGDAAQGGEPVPGPLKQLWASRFFLASGIGQPGADPVCGRFDPTLCAQFLDATDSGVAGEDLLTALRRHGPADTVGDIEAPVYLLQGQSDSLFGLDQADANARALLDAGTPTAVRWIAGGHDSLGTDVGAASDESSVRTWLAGVLPAEPGTLTSDDLPVPAFAWATDDGLAEADAYPSSLTPDPAEVALTGGAQPLLNPPGGQPSSLTLVPSTGSAAVDEFSGQLSTYALAALPGQSAAFDTAALDTGLSVVGAPTVSLTVTSTASSATLFLSLWTVTGGPGSDQATLPRGLVAPVTVATTPGVPTTLQVALPGGVRDVAAGESLRVLVTSTDQTYAGPRAARADRVEVTDLRLPTVDGTVAGGSGTSGLDSESAGVLLALVVLVLGLLGAALLRRRRRRSVPRRGDLADVPLVVDSLVKTYSDGHRAVDDVSWRAERGQVVGLLGPNGAGKTTTLRMVLGLIRPDSGTSHVLGEEVGPGSPVLGRVGALVEGPGFLPHLTGRQNLEAYWAATGRDAAEAGYDEVLDVAALGGAVDRPVRTYSQGMRQRLGIAQAMLGHPEVLVLDEPTNGLDPPQIAGLRPILHRYAAAGRTVVVSSHLLSEVEMTCSHVVVMHAGRVVTTGTVAELVDSSDTTVVTLADAAGAAGVATRLRDLDGITGVEVHDERLVVTATLPRAEVVRAVAASGADVETVSSRRQLEEVFLGVIAAASGAGDPDHPDAAIGADDLRKVRSR